MRKSSSSAVGYKLSSTTVSFRGGTDSRPHQKRKKVAIGGYDKKMKRTLFFCIQICIVPSGNKYLPDLSNDPFDFGTRSIPQTRLDLVEHFFLSRKCVCMCVYVCHYFIIRSSHITFLTIHIYVWYDLIRSTLCVCVSNSQGKKSIERNAVRVYCAWRGLNFRVSTYCILYFSTVYCSEGREKNIWRKYTVREVGFSS